MFDYIATKDMSKVTHNNTGKAQKCNIKLF